MNFLGFLQAFLILVSLPLRTLCQPQWIVHLLFDLRTAPAKPMNDATILVVDEEPQIRRVLRVVASLS
jgi:hypothetical protein